MDSVNNKKKKIYNFIIGILQFFKKNQHGFVIFLDLIKYNRVILQGQVQNQAL